MKETKLHEKKEAMAKKMKYGKIKMPSDKQMEKEIRENAKRIRSNPNHPIMKMEEEYRKNYRAD